MPSSTLPLPAISIASTTKSASIRAWDIIHRSSSNAWHMPSKVSTKSDEDHAPGAAVLAQTFGSARRTPLRYAARQYRPVIDAIFTALLPQEKNMGKVLPAIA